MNRADVLAAFDRQVRQCTGTDGTGATYEADEFVVRRLAAPGCGGSTVLWSSLNESIADVVIAAEAKLFAHRGDEVEWKLYSYDRPADLADRLILAGFRPEDSESLMIAQIDEITDALRSAELPKGVRFERATDDGGVDRLIRVHELVFGHDESALRASLLAQLRNAPDTTDLLIAMAGDEPVSAARTEYVLGTEFAGLWGGGTLPSWRRRGIYRALVRRRAELASERGYRYLTVDASEQSRPILERIGFECLAVTTPYIRLPG